MQVKVLTEIGNHGQGADRIETRELSKAEIIALVKGAASKGWQKYVSVVLADGRGQVAYASRNADRCGDMRPEWRAGSWGWREVPDGQATIRGVCP